MGGFLTLLIHDIVEQVALGYISWHELLALIVSEPAEVWDSAEKFSFQIDLFHLHLPDEPLVVLFV
jgi:hypothetical protein